MTVKEYKMFGGMRVEVVHDDDAAADPLIPKDVLARLGPFDVLFGLNMLYTRDANWERIKHRFPLRAPGQQARTL
jgi:hypothetical protein